MTLYFDHNATTSILPKVQDAMLTAMNNPLNPSSVHSFGRHAKALIEEARNRIASMMGVNLRKDGYNLVFTASATEANNLVAVSRPKILASSTEHISILKHAVDILRVNGDGLVDIQKLEDWLKLNPGASSLVSIMFANNETGVIQPVKEIAALVHKYEALIHSDCVQAPGKIPCNLLDLDVDFASISAHKFGGPLGAAALIYKEQHQLFAQIIGGGQERSVRAGTENVPAIVGFGVATQHTNYQSSELRDMFEVGVMNTCSDAIIFGQNAPRLMNTSMVYMPNVLANLQVISFDMKGMAVSSGSACSSGKVKISHVLTAMGVESQIANCAIRFSFGHDNTHKDVVELIDAWRGIYRASL